MSNHTDPLSQLKVLLKSSQESLQVCAKSYKGFRVFKGNRGGIEFCTVQLQEAATALRDQANALLEIAEELQVVYQGFDMPEQLPLQDFDRNGQQ
jgi:hypothetical protein